MEIYWPIERTRCGGSLPVGGNFIKVNKKVFFFKSRYGICSGHALRRIFWLKGVRKITQLEINNIPNDDEQTNSISLYI